MSSLDVLTRKLRRIERRWVFWFPLPERDDDAVAHRGRRIRLVSVVDDLHDEVSVGGAFPADCQVVGKANIDDAPGHGLQVEHCAELGDSCRSRPLAARSMTPVSMGSR